MTKTKVIFMGTPEFAVKMLDVLVEVGMDVVAVVTQPDKPVGRRHEIQFSPVKIRALSYGFHVLQPIKIGESSDVINALDADLIVTCAYGQFIPSRILEHPTFGAINVHASLLPQYRGGAPIHKAIIDGQTKTGISIMRMVKKMDAGDVMARSEVDISHEDTVGTLHDKLQASAADLLRKSLPVLLNGNAVWEIQDETQATFAYNITKEQEFIAFNRPAADVYNHIRGLIPWPVGYGVVANKKIKFHQVALLPDKVLGKPGEVLGLIDGAFAVQALNGIILLRELQLEGKGKANALDFNNGFGKSLLGVCFDEKHES
ncbi:MAG: methionyl-tRNA formyltransferase [Erysipelotrichaceae bacterium]